MHTRPKTTVYSFESWLFTKRYPTKEHVLKTIRNWDVYSHGIRLNEVFLDKDGKPEYKTVNSFYLPRDINILLDALVEMSIMGYRVFSIARDCLSGIYFDLDPSHQTNIDADLIEAILEHAKKVSTYLDEKGYV